MIYSKLLFKLSHQKESVVVEHKLTLSIFFFFIAHILLKRKRVVFSFTYPIYRGKNSKTKNTGLFCPYICWKDPGCRNTDSKTRSGAQEKSHPHISIRVFGKRENVILEGKMFFPTEKKRFDPDVI